jgi:two-component system, NtrC family, response regulator GlrR
MTNPPDDSTADVRATDALAPAAQGHALVQQFRLRVVDGPDAGQTQVSGRERLVIGTHESADLVLTDPTVSRFHCEITIADGKAALRDLDSRNGTVIGDVEVAVGGLCDGAMLTLGQTRLRFELTADHVKVPVSDRESFGAMRGRSRTMRSVFAKLERAARKEVTVLLIGETGTGKDVAAEAIHRESKRAHQPFAIVDCGSIPGPLLESHERGAFTGADRARAGAFEAATGGTLFLDEIGELALDLQPKLLRVLEDRSVQRLGSTKRTPVDVMVIAATNRNLRAEVNCHRFRADLYYRLAVLEVTLPPLRTRPEDLPDLVDAVLDNIGADPSAAAALRNRDFIAGLSPYLARQRPRAPQLPRTLPRDGATAAALAGRRRARGTADRHQPAVHDRARSLATLFRAQLPTGAAATPRRQRQRGRAGVGRRSDPPLPDAGALRSAVIRDRRRRPTTSTSAIVGRRSPVVDAHPPVAGGRKHASSVAWSASRRHAKPLAHES